MASGGADSAPSDTSPPLSRTGVRSVYSDRQRLFVAGMRPRAGEWRPRGDTSACLTYRTSLSAMLSESALGPDAMDWRPRPIPIRAFLPFRRLSF